MRVPFYPSLVGGQLHQATEVMPWGANFNLHYRALGCYLDRPEPYRFGIEEWRDKFVFRLVFVNGYKIDEWNIFDKGRPKQETIVESMSVKVLEELQRWYREVELSDTNPRH